ncbi:hypothetical protein M717_02950 [Neisseria gonorrhoeae SK33414]|nr:hypothetical protein M717_02950 [Neisseria gonorrhoeae SK33414]KLT00014.1 hypothetical protein M671_10030 [Neisseria gonorrhoeae CH811]
MTDKCADGGKREGQYVLFHAPCGGEYDGQHDDQSGIEENREAENQRGNARRERCAFFAEHPDQRVRQRLCAAGCFYQTSEHCAQTDQKRHAAERAAEVFDQYVVDDAACGQTGCQSRQQAGDDQCQQRADAEFDD